MLKSLIAALIASSLICPGRADAQAQADPDTVAVAIELITTMRITDQFKLQVPTILQGIKPLVVQGWPEIEREFDAVTPVVLEAMNARVNELLSQIAGIYARNFTASEMRRAVAFYRTPAGQKFLDKSPVLTQETATIGQNIGRTLAAEMRGRMVDELRKRGQSL